MFSACEQSQEALYEKAIQLSDDGEHSKAIPIFTELIQRNGKNELARFERAISWFYLDSNQNALNDLNTILASKPDIEIIVQPAFATSDNKWKISKLEVLFQTALVKYAMDSLISAYIDFNTCLDYNYQPIRSNVYIGSILMLSGQKQKACEHFRKAALYNDKEAMKYLETECH